MKTKLLILVLGLQTAWILSTTVVQEHSLATGKVILLETRPVDPRDLLRGDYVILNYKISDVPWSLFSPPLTHPLPEGQNVFVALTPQGEFHGLARVSTNPPAPVATEIVLRGKSAHGWNDRTGQSQRVQYGLERYYVREGTGNPRGKITVQVAVTASGRGMVKQVFLDGQPYAEAMKDAGK